jgi:hypothetical protein
MKVRPLLAGFVLADLGLALAGALLSRNGIGVFEWAVGGALVAILLAGAAHFARQSLSAA